MSQIVSKQVPLTASLQATRITDFLSKDFGFSVKDRLHVAPEVAMYRIGEDVSIWEQVKNSKYKFEIYFDGEFICWANDDDSLDQVRLNFLRGFRDKYVAGKIHLDPTIYEIEALQAKQKADLEANKDLIENPTTPEEKIINEAVRRVKKSKKHDNKKAKGME